jgi:hypothetical protein
MKTQQNIKKISLGKIVLGIASALAVGVIATSGIASAFQGDPSIEGPNFNAEIHDQMEAAFDAYDYATWKDLMEESGHAGRVLDVVTEENFNTFVDAHNAAEEGDFETANALRAELGLNNGMGPQDGTGFKGMRGQGMGQNREGLGRMDRLNIVDSDGDGVPDNFVDSDGDGVCDNPGLGRQRGARLGRGRV